MNWSRQSGGGGGGGRDPGGQPRCPCVAAKARGSAGGKPADPVDPRVRVVGRRR